MPPPTVQQNHAPSKHWELKEVKGSIDAAFCLCCHCVIGSWICLVFWKYTLSISQKHLKWHTFCAKTTGTRKNIFRTWLRDLISAQRLLRLDFFSPKDKYSLKADCWEMEGNSFYDSFSCSHSKYREIYRATYDKRCRAADKFISFSFPLTKQFTVPEYLCSSVTEGRREARKDGATG